jgi:hypothetical protein
MTIAELNDLIARGAAQPGVREVEELMRLTRELDEQTRGLADIYATAITTTASSNSMKPLAAHADVG